MKNNQNIPSTQDHLSIKEIKDHLVILKDGTISLVIQTNAVNFDLLSEEEQDSKIYAFAQLLNSMTHSFQIFIRTKKVFIGNYLDYIKSFENKQKSLGLKRQMNIYTKFVKNLILKNEILDKDFYIIIPYRTYQISVDPVKQLMGKDSPVTNTDKILNQAKAYLYPKRDHVMKQFGRMGLKSHQLTTEQLAKMFFELYNPGKSFNQEDDNKGTNLTNEI